MSKNKKILKTKKQWEKFVNSETESEAQKEVKNLLELLILKIQIK